MCSSSGLQAFDPIYTIAVEWKQCLGAKGFLSLNPLVSSVLGPIATTGAVGEWVSAMEDVVGAEGSDPVWTVDCMELGARVTGGKSHSEAVIVQGTKSYS